GGIESYARIQGGKYMSEDRKVLGQIHRHFEAPTDPHIDTELSTADLARTGERTAEDAEFEDLDEIEPPEITRGKLGGPDVVDVCARPRDAGGEGARTAGVAVAPAMATEKAPLFGASEANELRGQWDAIQVGFVDEPKQAVEKADKLGAGTMKRLAEVFAEERGRLEEQWDQGENVSTEDLRLALQRYRSFFGRLLTV